MGIRVYKFGGASVNDASGIRRLGQIVATKGSSDLVIVVSAMGKMTNALEEVVRRFDDHEAVSAQLNLIRSEHMATISELELDQDAALVETVNKQIQAIDSLQNDPDKADSRYLYDQVVSKGEILSTAIVNAHLNKIGISSSWADARLLVRTDNSHKEGVVQWDATLDLIQRDITPLLAQGPVVTQGFIGGTKGVVTTTLGREGSDYSAAIFAYCLDAEEVVIWKDVPGVLTADPRYRPDAPKINQLSYHEAIEMTFYGAKVIHPKTIKPLQNKRINLRVMPFMDPDATGTLIGHKLVERDIPPVVVIKKDQVLLSIKPKDFSFMNEEMISRFYGLFAEYRIKVNMMQVSAITFTVSVNNHRLLDDLIFELSDDFMVLKNDGLQLLTIRHYTDESIQEHVGEKRVMLEQKSRNTVHLVVRT
jgi:aspartate kinase